MKHKKILTFITASALIFTQLFVFSTPGAASPGSGGVYNGVAYDFLVTDYGAIPGDGACDVAAIQSALDAAATAGGGIVLLPDGEYTITSRTGTTHHIQLENAANITLRGESRDGAILNIVYPYGDTQTGNNKRTSYVMRFNNCANLELAEFTIEGNNTPWYSASIIRVDNASHNAYIHNLKVQNFPFDCLSSMNNVSGVVRGEAPWAIHVVGGNQAAQRPQGVRVEFNEIYNISNKWNDPGGTWVPRGNEDEMNGGAIRLQRVDYAKVNDNYIDNTGRGGVHVRNGSSYVDIKRNVVKNTGVGKFDNWESDGGHDHQRGIGLDALAIEIWGGGNHHLVIEDNEIDSWLSLDATNHTAVRRNTIGGKELRLWTGLESAGSEDAETRYNVFTDNEIYTGMTGISMSNNGMKDYHYFGHNVVHSIPMWGVNLHGFAEDEWAPVSGIDRLYFYDLTVTGTKEDDVGVHYLWNGHAIKFVNKVTNVTFDNCNIYDNDGYAFYVGVIDDGDPPSWSNDGIYVVNSNISENRKGVFNIEDWPDAYTTKLEIENTQISGNGTKVMSGDGGGTYVNGDNVPVNMPYANPPPVAKIIAPEAGVAGQPINFASASYALNGAAIPAESYLWDMDASYPMQGGEVTFTYDEPGVYRVALLVWDSDGRGAITEHYITIYDASTALVSVDGPATVVSGAGATASYTISAANMQAVSALEFEFEVDGAFLSSKEFTASGGFGFLGDGNYGTDIFWKNIGDRWIGKATLINSLPGGANGDDDLLSMVFDVREGALGSASVKLNYVRLSYAGETVAAGIARGEAATMFEKYYSPYDLNKDDVIDLNDLTYALQYLLVELGDANWDEAKIMDYNDDKKIDTQDLILILANYTIPYYS